MPRILSFLLWAAVFLLILLAFDQLLVRVPARHPAHAAVADFYRDLRTRAIDLARGANRPPVAAPAKIAPPVKGRVERPAPAPSIEGIISQRQVGPPVPDPAGTGAKPRYVYADRRGELHFAETLAEVPAEYRGKAKALGE